MGDNHRAVKRRKTDDIRDNELSDLALAELEKSGIDIDFALKGGLYSVHSARDIALEFHDRPALVYPYYTLDNEPAEFSRGEVQIAFIRLKYLILPPAMKDKKTGKKRKPQRYAQYRNSPVLPYFPPIWKKSWREMLDKDFSFVNITEGEKKTLKACQEDIPTIGLGGVWNYMQKDDT